MNEHDIASFILDMDEIIAGKRDISSAAAGHDQDKEYQDLLLLAQLLAKTDFSTETLERGKRLWSNLHKEGRLADDDLDQVAGGFNLNAMYDEKEKKK